MPDKIKSHRLSPPAKSRTLLDKQQSNGRTLALNSKAWSQLRLMVIREQPLCAECSKHGRLVAGNEVDHIDNDPGNNERDNLVNLCHRCHSVKTQRHEHYKRTGRLPSVKGCDVHGMPLDPNHHWNKSPAADSAGPPPCLHARDRNY